jgi:hypothetical protein
MSKLEIPKGSAKKIMKLNDEVTNISSVSSMRSMVTSYILITSTSMINGVARPT